MKRLNLTRPPEQMLDIAGRLASSERRDWIRAMRADLAAIDDQGEAFEFALGCVRAAAIDRLRRRSALAAIGSVCLGAGLIALAIGCLIVSRGIDDGSPAGLVLSGLGLIYLFGALALAIGRRRGLIGYAVGSAGLAGVIAATLFSIDALTPAELRHHAFYLALAIEHVAIMSAVLLACVYLNLLGDDGGLDADAGLV